MLVLNGPQGMGKSTFYALLGREWFSDSLSIADMRDKTAAEKLQGYWILEIAEMNGIKKVDHGCLAPRPVTLTGQNRRLPVTSRRKPRSALLEPTMILVRGWLSTTVPYACRNQELPGRR